MSQCRNDKTYEDCQRWENEKTLLWSKEYFALVEVMKAAEKFMSAHADNIEVVENRILFPIGQIPLIWDNHLAVALVRAIEEYKKVKGETQ